MSKHINKSPRIAATCKCGCGELVPQVAGAGRPRVWIQNHKPGRTTERLCGCGCGEYVFRTEPTGRLPKYVAGHKAPKRAATAPAVESEAVLDSAELAVEVPGPLLDESTDGN